jgi:hypothetical protein
LGGTVIGSSSVAGFVSTEGHMDTFLPHNQSGLVTVNGALGRESMPVGQCTYIHTYVRTYIHTYIHCTVSRVVGPRGNARGSAL